MKSKIAFILAAVLVAPVNSWATYPVFDATAYAQLLKTYDIGSSQLNQLGKIVGLNTQQLATMNGIRDAVGVATGSVDPRTLTARQLTALAQGLGLDMNGAINKMYQKSGPFAGALDVFMGTSIQSFRAKEGGPWEAFTRAAVNGSIEAIGLSLDMPSREIAFAQRVASMDAATRKANKDQISMGLAQLALDRFASAAENRRVTMQAEANIANEAAKRASAATTLNETASASAELAASQARMQAVAAQQANAANETLIIQGDRTNTVLNEMEARRKREEVERSLSKEARSNVY